MKRTFLSAVLVMILSAPVFAAERPNVIVLSVDAMRASEMSFYGYPRETTPFFDGIMKEGTAFNDASAMIPLTNPSVSAFFSSQPPYKTQAVRNGVPARKDLETFAGILRAHGYTTAAVVGCAPLNKGRSGLAKDFDHWLDAGTEVLLELEAGIMTWRAEKLVERGLKEPFLFYIHFPDPHQPHYTVPGFNFGKLPPAGGERDKMEDAYDSEIAYCDHGAARIMAAMKKMGYLDNALVIVTADHGEELGGEGKGATGHGRKLFQTVLRIPFSMTGPGIPAGKRIGDPVEILDFAPTILDYLGLPIGREMMGRSLWPTIKDGAALKPVPFFFESYGFMVMAALDPVQRLIGKRSPAVIVGAREGNLKIIHLVKKNVWEMYDIAADPKEVKDIFKPGDPDSVRMAELLANWYNQRGRGEAPITPPQ